MKFLIEIYLWMKIIGGLLPVALVILFGLGCGILILWLIITGAWRRHKAKKLDDSRS